MLRLRDRLSFRSRLAYMLWRATGYPYELQVRLAANEVILLRPPPATDVAIAYEVFAAEVYKSPRQITEHSIYRIVDVGSNVGFSLLWWLRSYPAASIIAFEPHPDHVRQIQRQLELNRSANRVILNAAAAGDLSGEMFLTDRGAESQLHASDQAGSLRVPVVDWFETIGPEPIDLLKMDIEGGEYSLLNDPRFARLDCKICVTEWHRTSEIPDGGAWCKEKFERLGYQVVPGKVVTECTGLLWAFRSPSTTYSTQ